MTTIELLKPWRIIVCLIPCLYAGLLIWELNNSRMWLIFAAVALVMLFCVISALGYPPLIFMPVFVGTFLLLAGVFALYAGLPSYDISSDARSPFEVWVALPLALAYIGWGTVVGRRFLYYV